MKRKTRILLQATASITVAVVAYFFSHPLFSFPSSSANSLNPPASTSLDTDTDTDTDTSLATDADELEASADLDEAEVQTNAEVTHVVDGDTLDADLEGVGEVRVRLLGVNTPETVDPRKPVECFGKAASDFSKKKMPVGTRIRLEPDPQADERDKYGRLLRNVILADGTDYNAFLVEQGYAYAYLSFPLDPQRKTQLKQLERAAKEAKRGLWGAGCK